MSLLECLISALESHWQFLQTFFHGVIHGVIIDFQITVVSENFDSVNLSLFRNLHESKLSSEMNG